MGSRAFNAFGAHGSEAYVDFRHYPSLEECCADLKRTQGEQCGGGRWKAADGRCGAETHGWFECVHECMLELTSD